MVLIFLEGGNVTVQTGKLINGACVNLASSGEVPLELEVTFPCLVVYYGAVVTIYMTYYPLKI